MALETLRLTEKHMNSLRDCSGNETSWLSDEVINAFSKTLLGCIDPKIFAILSTTGTLFRELHNLRPPERNTKTPIIVAPVCVCMHWVLVVVNYDRGLISYFDSARQENASALRSQATQSVMRALTKHQQSSFPHLADIDWNQKSYKQVGLSVPRVLPSAGH
jgi:Ulp1 protease family, C-terminal catalytic domain